MSSHQCSELIQAILERILDTFRKRITPRRGTPLYHVAAEPVRSSGFPLTGARYAANDNFLQVLLEEALISRRIQRLMLWPLVVLGVEAVNGGAAMCAFVEEQLSEMSRTVAPYMPLTANSALENFWSSAKTRLDLASTEATSSRPRLRWILVRYCRRA